MPFGRTLLGTSTVLPTRVSADGNPQYKPGGITLDLTTIPAASGSDVTLADGSIVKANSQYLRYGQVLTKITGGTVQTATWTGGATAGNAFLTVAGQTSAAIAFNASAAVAQAAIQALTTVGPNKATVGRTGAGTAGDPYIYTVTFHNSLGAVAAITATHTFTGGTTPTVTIAVTTAGTAAGKFGPYDPAASDGRQTLTRGEAYILDETWLANPAGTTFAGLGSTDIIGGVMEAGLVWFDRLIQSGVVTATLALGPTLATFEAVFPEIRYVKN